MSILINKNQYFTLEIKGYYRRDEQGTIISFKKSSDGNVSLICRYTGRDFDTMSKIIEESSIINSVNGKPLLRSGIFTKLIVLNFFKDINIISENENSTIVIDKDIINKIHYDIIKYMAQKWLELTNGI